MTARLRYAAVLQAPHVLRLLTTALVSRAPIGVDGLAIVLFVRAEYGSYATAGAVAACFAAGAAVVGPLMGRLVDRLGARRVLVPLALAHAAGLGALILLGSAGVPAPVLFVTALLAGSSIPPVGSVLRALWPTLLRDREDLLTTAYALDSVLLEVAFILGPVVVAGAAALGSPQLALLLSIVLVVIGTVAFTATQIVRDFSPADDHAHDTGGRLGAVRSPGVRTLALATLPVGFCLGACEVAFPAFGEFLDNRALAGPLLAVWSAGSAVGGLLYGAHAHRMAIDRTYLATMALLPVVTLPLALPSSFAVMVPLALLAGCAVAPLISAANQLIGDIAPQGALTEAYTWLLTALVAGVAAGNAASGLIVDAIDWRAAFVMAAAVGTLGFAVAAVRRATLRPPVAAPAL